MKCLLHSLSGNIKGFIIAQRKRSNDKNVAIFFDLNFQKYIFFNKFIFGLHVTLIPIIHHC